VADLVERGAAAFLAAAVGDALGWPQENRSSIVDRKVPSPSMSFRAWRRRSGNRFSPYEEVIGAGEYSDDTQMICSVARSFAGSGPRWYDQLTGSELPAFPLYQRGAGRALLEACRSWAAGVPPWVRHSSNDPKSYYGAGGNGGAMRVLPHALNAAAADSPVSVNDVFRDVTATHGHLRAIVGAFVQAVALRTALLVGGTLGYGELLEALLDDPKPWATPPDAESMPEGWLAARSETGDDSFEGSWRSTIEEMTSLLITARQGMRTGALSREQETLRDLGCTGTKTVGSATVSAAGAVFLASRSAANPRAGLLSAAFLPKADTDTLASMTASLLGAFAGREWLGPLDTEVQDSSYIMDLAREVTLGNGGPSQSRATRAGLDVFTSRLERAVPGDTIDFPDGRKTAITEKEELVSKSEGLAAERYRLRAADGQTLFVVRTHRRPKQAQVSSDQLTLPAEPGNLLASTAPAVVRVGVKLNVLQLETMRHFYEDVLGLSPSRWGVAFVTFNDILALTLLRDPGPAAPGRCSIYVEVTHIAELWRRVQKSGVRVVDPLGVESGYRRFRCLDPEANLLEIREDSK
jgi:ADP-ribosylglycohydrolase/predicted enzyme related to lactoylglutathione lyase